jgi:hypothetical protein
MSISFGIDCGFVQGRFAWVFHIYQQARYLGRLTKPCEIKSYRIEVVVYSIELVVRFQASLLLSHTELHYLPGDLAVTLCISPKGESMVEAMVSLHSIQIFLDSIMGKFNPLVALGSNVSDTEVDQLQIQSS